MKKVYLVFLAVWLVLPSPVFPQKDSDTTLNSLGFYLYPISSPLEGEDKGGGYQSYSNILPNETLSVKLISAKLTESKMLPSPHPDLPPQRGEEIKQPYEIVGKSQFYSPGELIVKFRASRGKLSSEAITRLKALEREFGVRETRGLFPAHRGVLKKGSGEEDLDRVYLFSLGNSDVLNAASAYAKESFVEYAQPNYLNTFLGRPNDPRYDEQWSLKKINWEGVWEKAQGYKKVIVAIIDSGVDYNHEDVKDNIWINEAELNGLPGVDDDGNGYVDDIRGWDFTDAPTLPGIGDYKDRDNDPMDESGHGTHVAGIIGASVNNSIGIAGIAPNCQLMALRAGFHLSIGNFLQDDDVSAAIVYAVDNGANIINMSWGDSEFSPLIRDVTRYAYNRNCVLVASAGNEGKEGLYFPAGLDQVISTAASDGNDELASVSSYGWNLDVVAPGINILSTLPDNTYGAWSGTSMAAPHVAGLAALILGEHPEYSPEEVRSAIISSARDLGKSGWDVTFGSGRIDIQKAMLVNNPTVAQIIAPETTSNVDSSVAITVTVTGKDLLSYELAYGQGTNPSVWNLLVNSKKEQLWQQILATWRTSELPDSLYTLRLLAQNIDRSIEDRIIVSVSHNPPDIEHVRVVQRLDGPRYVTSIEWTTDKMSSGQIEFRPTNSKEVYHLATSGSVSTVHSVKFADGLPPGDYEFRIIAIISSNLRSTSRDSIFTVKGDLVSEDRLRKVSSLPNGYLLNQLTDFDGNGRKEVVLMQYGETTYGSVSAYEIQQDGSSKEVWKSQERFLPWNSGDVNSDGKPELMGVNSALLRLFETSLTNAFPDKEIWRMSGTWGGEVADLYRDGKMEIAARSDEAKGLVIFENTEGNKFMKVVTLRNPTEGDNNLCTRSVIGDFDNDGKVEIISGDSDGDVYLYEVVGKNIFRVEGIYRTPGSDARYLAGGADLDQDGKLEFVVARAIGNNLDPEGSYWVISVYQSTSENEYEVEWQTEILGSQNSGSGLSTGDIDGDEIPELIVCLPPHLYVFRHTGADRYAPIWYSTAEATYVPVVGDVDMDGLSELIFNNNKSVQIYRPVSDSTGLESPPALTVIPLDSTSVEIRWDEPYSGNNLYEFYRGTSPDSLVAIFAGEFHSPYIDSGLIEGTTYYYAISRVDSTLPPIKGRLSTVYAATPSRPPRLILAEVLSPWQVALKFSTSMDISVEEPGDYQLLPDELIPSSALRDRNEDSRVLLSFERRLTSGRHAIRVERVRSKTKVYIDLNSNSAEFNVAQETTSPKIISAEALSDTKIRLTFSHGIEPSSLSPDLFSILPDIIISDIVIDSLESNKVILFLSKSTPIGAKGYTYRISVDGIRAVSDGVIKGEVSLKLSRQDLREIFVFPNPFRLSGVDSPFLTFANLTKEATIKIFTLQGQLIKTLRESDGNGGITWDGRSENGRTVGSGIYIYIVENANERKLGKFALVN